MVDGGGVRGGEQGRRFARKQRDPEAVERELEAVAMGLDVGLFAGPATEEGGVALFGDKAEPVVAFSRGEEALDDGFLFVHVADELDIDAELAVVGEGEDGELAECVRLNSRGPAGDATRGLPCSAYSKRIWLGATPR